MVPVHALYSYYALATVYSFLFYALANVYGYYSIWRWVDAYPYLCVTQEYTVYEYFRVRSAQPHQALHSSHDVENDGDIVSKGAGLRCVVNACPCVTPVVGHTTRTFHSVDSSYHTPLKRNAVHALHVKQKQSLLNPLASTTTTTTRGFVIVDLALRMIFLWLPRISATHSRNLEHFE